MSLESFYGGKQGISPVIKASFQYVDIKDPAYGAAIQAKTPENGTIPTEEKAKIDAATMDIVLADSNYEDVWYNELCIINTTNKANKNNGKLYRRTLKGRGDKDLENHSAEYIGQIVGPPGANPFMAFKSIGEVNTEIHDDNYTINENTVISWPKTNGEEVIYSSEKPVEGVNPHVFSASTSNGMIVPGKVDDENYNDNIRYTWFNIVDNTTEEDDSTKTKTQSMVYLGFQIPYPSIDITTKEVNWNENVESTKRSGKGYDGHPFYHSWDINIPRGIRGNAAGNIRLAKYEDFAYKSDEVTVDKPFLYDYEKSVETNGDTGSFIISQTNEAGSPTIPDIFLNKENIPIDMPFWVYDYTFYDKTNTKTCTFYLGSYKEIKDINFDENGTITFIYSDMTEDKEFKQLVQWVKEISIEDSGLITFTYNTLNPNFIEIQDESFISGKDYYEPIYDYEKIPDDEPLSEGKTYYIIDANGEYVESEDVQRQDGKDYYEYVVVKYELTQDELKDPTKTYYELNNNSYSYQLPFPTSLNIDEDGKITVFLSGEEKDFELVLKSGEEDFLLNYVNSLSMDENSKVLSYTTSPNNKEEELNSGEGINYLKATLIDERYHLMMYHASSQFRPILNFESIGDEENPEYQYFDQYDNVFTLIGKNEELSTPMQLKNLDNNTSILIWNNGLIYKNGIECNELYSIPSSDFWQDLGLVRQISQGLRVTHQFNLNSYPDQTDFEDLEHDDFINNVLNQPYWQLTEETERIENPYYGGNIPNEGGLINDPSLRGAFCYTPLIEDGTAYYYDYVDNSWRYVGKWDTSGTVDICINEEKTGTKLSEYGVKLKTRSANESTTPTSLPVFWQVN